MDFFGARSGGNDHGVFGCANRSGALARGGFGGYGPLRRDARARLGAGGPGDRWNALRVCSQKSGAFVVSERVSIQAKSPDISLSGDDDQRVLARIGFGFPHGIIEREEFAQRPLTLVLRSRFSSEGGIDDQ